MSDLFDLTGRRALVTGGDGGIGHAIAQALAEHGARLAIHALDPAGAARATAALRAGGATVDVVDADFTRDDAGDRVFAAIGDIDILILNAAIEHRAAWDAVTLSEIDLHIRANFWANLRLMQLAVPGMVGRGWGRVLSIGSVQQRRANPRALVYAALKTAQESMVRSIARQVAASGVTVNTLSPGATITPRSEMAFEDGAFRVMIERKIPVGRIGMPTDCAGAALLLCSDAGSYITGADLPIDGGWSVHEA